MEPLLRLSASLKYGHATASLVVGKLHASSRRSAVAQALVEYGSLQCTIFALRYLADEAYRRRITRQLNKGETLHSLDRDLSLAHEGAIRRRHLDQQTELALGEYVQRHLHDREGLRSDRLPAAAAGRADRPGHGVTGQLGVGQTDRGGSTSSMPSATTPKASRSGG